MPSRHIETLSQKMDRMALKSDLGDLQSKLEASTKAAVSEIVAPIKTDVADLQHNVHQLMNRMTAVEQKPVVQGSTQISAELFSLLDRADPAHKQIALLGFSDIAPADHIQHIEALLAKFPAFKACDYGTFYSAHVTIVSLRRIAMWSSRQPQLLGLFLKPPSRILWSRMERTSASKKPIRRLFFREIGL